MVSINPNTSRPRCIAGIDLTDDQYDALQAAADGAGRSLGQFIGDLLSDALLPPRSSISVYPIGPVEEAKLYSRSLNLLQEGGVRL